MSSSESAAAVAALLRQGAAEQNAGRPAAAEQHYRAALRLDPGHPETLGLLGMLMGQTGRLPVAAAFFRRGLERDPDHLHLLHNLGETYRHLGDHAKAQECFARALAVRPQHYPAHRSAADAAFEAAERAAAAGQPAAAETLRAQGLASLAKLGATLMRLGLFDEAETAYREVLALTPRSIPAHLDLAVLLRQLGRLGEAIVVVRQAIAIAPRAAPPYAHLGNLLYDLGRTDEAAAAFRKSLDLDPKFSEARDIARSVHLMTLHYDPALSAAQVAAVHRAWGAETVARYGATASPPFGTARDPARRLRVGYVSPDFRWHSVAHFFEPLLAHHDAAQVESFCYAEVKDEDPVTVRLKSLAQHWRSTVGVGDEDFRRQIRADGIDVLIDLAGHTAGNRIEAFAVRPAPVTAAWLGYPGITGLPTIDWRITDALADPPGAEAVDGERLLRLAHGFLCFAPLAPAPDVAPLPALRRGHVTFGSFNNPQKTKPAVIETWAAILRAVPESRLVCKSRVFAEPTLRQRHLDLFAAQGVAAARIELRGWNPHEDEHLRGYGEIDVALDPFPYNGATTSCEALWMGVPVVALVGDRHAGRVGLSLLTHAGLADYAAPDAGAYVARAVALAADLPALSRLRGGLRARVAASPLCDAPGFARAFEAGIRQIWRGYCAAAG
jgi:protein O-GlcNAc transferase